MFLWWFLAALLLLAVVFFSKGLYATVKHWNDPEAFRDESDD